MSEFRRRLMMAGKALPYDAEVLYIENTGSQYIDTGFKPNQDTRIVARMQCITSTSYGRVFGCGAWNAIGGVAVDYETNITGTLHVKFGNNTSWNNVTSVKGDYGAHTYDYNKNVFYLDGTQRASNTYSAFQSTSNLAIFTYINGSNIGGSTEEFKGCLYYFQIYDNDVLVRDFIPVRVGQIGYLYDKVSRQLFGNAGTGNFTIGADKSKGYYTELEYLRNINSTVSSAYINTGIYADSDTYVEIKCRSNELNAGKYNYRYPFGSRVNGSSGLFGMYYTVENIKYTFNTSDEASGVASDTAIHEFKFGNGSVIIDDVEVATLSGTMAATNRPLLLFACNENNSSSISAAFAFVGDIFYCKIYQGGVLVRDFVPVFDNSNYMFGMLDKVGNTFYGNVSTTGFIN